jgi:hypothetical protein
MVSVDGRKKSARIPVRGGCFFYVWAVALRLRLFTDAACQSSNPCVAPVGGVPFLTGRKGDGKSCTAKGPGQTIGPGARSIGLAPSAGPRVPSPEGEGQEEGTGWAPFTRVLDIVQHSISPLQGRDLEAGVLLCEKRWRSPEPKQPGPSPLPGEGGTGWVDRQRYRRLVPFPFYPACSPLSRGET